jgi:FAD/FMN-containing dehydrogenase
LIARITASAIKDAIDPLGIMNPGKVFPEPGGADAFRL